MNWLVFAIFVYLFLAVQLGLAPLFSIDVQFAGGDLTPQFMLMFAVYVGLFAPRSAVFVAWTVIGLLLDLTTTLPGGVVLIGPYALGCLAGAAVIIQLRVMVLRTHMFSHGFCVAVCVLAVQLFVVAALAVRNLYDPLPGYLPLRDLALRALIALYSAVVMIPLAWPLIKATPIFGFQVTKSVRR
jgi:hypothetical protein